MKKIFNANLNEKNIGEKVELYGWVQKIRNLGGLVFIDLRDRSGIVQVVIRPDNKFYEEALKIKNEYVLKISGLVVERENKNTNLKTGGIEIDLDNLEILNTSLDLPFEIKDDVTSFEDTRLKYRYLDIRRSMIRNSLLTRNKVYHIIRNYMYEKDFVEVETPILCKSTPEGARDYLVPSRVNKGKFYALPQSPQIYKQLLMIGGMERYYQIAKCFRDEDLRADRQPEFTQFDMEMSFVNQDDIMNIIEELLVKIFKEVKNLDLTVPFNRMKYDDAIKDYGSDKPDLRFDMKIKDLTDIFKDTDFIPFKGVLDNSGIINAIVVKENASSYSRKDLDRLTEFVKQYKASSLYYLKYNEEDFTGSIAKILTDDLKNTLINSLSLNENDLILIVADSYKVTKQSLGALRCKIAKDLDLIKKGDYKLLWVTDFPSFEYSEEEKRFVACHHPFTAPNDEDIDKLLTDKENCYSKAYDIVINGYEVGGGSIRIHDEQVQNKMFEALELTREDIEEKFGFFVDALKYGTPPHGGLAIGFERLIMILLETDNIRDVIAFPKTTSGVDLMCDAPSNVSKKQLDELGINISGKKEN